MIVRLGCLLLLLLLLPHRMLLAESTDPPGDDTATTDALPTPEVAPYEPPTISIRRWQLEFGVPFFYNFGIRTFTDSELDGVLGGSVTLSFHQRRIPILYGVVAGMTNAPFRPADGLLQFGIGIRKTWEKGHWAPSLFFDMGYLLIILSESRNPVSKAAHGAYFDLGVSLLAFQIRRVRVEGLRMQLILQTNAVHLLGGELIRVSIRL